MVFIKRIILKTGKTFSPASMFNMNSLTPSQKLELASHRIWGTQINTGYSTGIREWKKPDSIPVRKMNIGDPINDERKIYPYYRDSEIIERKKIKYEEKKFRVLMKGIKIGKKKGGNKIKLSDIFEKKE